MKLIIEDDEGRKTVVQLVRDEITIGRQDGNTIRLTERNVSRRHARLVKENGNVLIEDLGSYNGVRVNGETQATNVPGLFAAGTFYYHGELVFWNVRHPDLAIIVSLDHERYKKLIVEVEDPAGAVDRLRQAIGANHV